MADRRVRRTDKDSDGDITALCGDGWGRVSKATAISDINGKINSYYVQEGGLARVEVVVVGNHLQTTPDGKSANNLDNLPDC